MRKTRRRCKVSDFQTLPRRTCEAKSAVLLDRSRSRPGRGTSCFVVPLLVLCAGTGSCRGSPPVNSPSRGLPRSFPSQLAEPAGPPSGGGATLPPPTLVHGCIRKVRGNHELRPPGASFFHPARPSQHARSPLPLSTHNRFRLRLPLARPCSCSCSSLVTQPPPLRSLRFPPPRAPSGSPDLF